MNDDIEDLKQHTRLSQGAAIATPLLDQNNDVSPTINETNLRAPTTHNNITHEGGIRQPNQCNDYIFAIIFLIHFLSILFIVFEYGVPAISKINNTFSKNDENEEHYQHYLDYIQLSIFCCGFSFIITCIFKMIFTRLALRLSSEEEESSTNNDDKSIIIKFALGFSTITSILLSTTFYLLLNEIYLSILCFLFFIFSVSYGIIIKSQMKFASINLITSIRAIRSKYTGLTIASHAILTLGIFYISYWIIAMIGLYEDSKVNCEREGQEEHVICNDATPKNWNIILLFFNFYWAQQVIKNIIHVSVAGTIRTWWSTNSNHNDDNESLTTSNDNNVFCCCSKVVSDSLYNAMTYSFGSICLGSLLVTPVYILRIFIDYLQEDVIFLHCTCWNWLYTTLESIYSKFNKWGYVYVGMYGYPFTTSSQMSLSVLERRGWNIIISDDLITNIFGLIICIIGLTNGAVVLFLLDYHSDWFTDDTGGWRYVIFTTGFMIGVVISSIILGIIESSVNTIIVLFAEAPHEFDINHRQLSQQLRNTWREAYPGIC